MNRFKLFVNVFTPLCGAALFAAAVVRGIDIHTISGKVDLELIPLAVMGLVISVAYQIALAREHRKRQALDQHPKRTGNYE